MRGSNWSRLLGLGSVSKRAMCCFAALVVMLSGASLSMASSISGTVVTADTGQAARSFVASIYKWEESGYWWNQSEVWGNTNGSYSVESLVPGTYRVLFSPRGVYYDYLPMAYGGGGSEVEDGLDVIVPVDSCDVGIDGDDRPDGEVLLAISIGFVFAAGGPCT